MNSLLQTIAITAVPVIFAITVHEVAHGWVAFKLGDPTAKRLGRLTLNPLKHIDLIGTILVPIFMVMTTGLMFGWAKPVPVNWRNLGSPKRDMISVAAAGPIANLLMAVLWTVIMKLAFVFSGELGSFFGPLVAMAKIGVLVNAILMILNMLPIPPLDGGRVMTGLLPIQFARIYARLERFGLIIVVLLLVTGGLGFVLCQPVSWFQSGMAELIDVSPRLLKPLQCD